MEVLVQDLIPSKRTQGLLMVITYWHSIMQKKQFILNLADELEKNILQLSTLRNGPFYQ